MAASKDLSIDKGATFTLVLRWENPDKVIYRAITNVSAIAPARITSPAHGVPDGWLVAVSGVIGMDDINASSTPPRGRDFTAATVIDPNTIELNGIDASAFSAYVSGGYLHFYEPVDLTGYTAKMQVKLSYASTAVLTLGTATGEIVLDAAAATITVVISAASTTAINWQTALYDLELTSASGIVTRLVQGVLQATEEVTQ